MTDVKLSFPVYAGVGGRNGYGTLTALSISDWRVYAAGGNSVANPGIMIQGFNTKGQHHTGAHFEIPKVDLPAFIAALQAHL